MNYDVTTDLSYVGKAVCVTINEPQRKKTNLLSCSHNEHSTQPSDLYAERSLKLVSN